MDIFPKAEFYIALELSGQPSYKRVSSFNPQMIPPPSLRGLICYDIKFIYAGRLPCKTNKKEHLELCLSTMARSL